MHEYERSTPEQVAEFVRNHFARNPDCTLEHLTNGWRVRFGRALDARELRTLQEVYGELDRARQARRAQELAEARARRPRGPINRFLALRWKGQMAIGFAVFMIGLFGLTTAFYESLQASPIGVLFGGTGATGSRPPEPALSPGAASLQNQILEHKGVQAATSFLFWTVLVTGGVGGVVILLISWGIGYGLIRLTSFVLRRPIPDTR